MRQSGKIKVYGGILLGMLVLVPLMCELEVHAAEAIVKNSFENLRSIIAATISSIGFLVVLWGISEMGMSMQSSDGVMQAQAFKRMGGGLLMTLAPQLLTLFLSS